MINLFNISLIDNLNTSFKYCNNIIIYHITYIDKNPFIQLLLTYNTNSKTFDFPMCSQFKSLLEITEYCNQMLDSFLMKKCNKNDIIFKGIQSFNNSSFCIIEISNIRLFNLFSTNSDIFSLTTIPEIIYNKYIFDRKIDESVVNYIKSNLDSYLVKDNYENIIPLPTIGYIIQSSKLAKYTNIFGILNYSNNQIDLYSSFNDTIKYVKYQTGATNNLGINKMLLFGKIDFSSSSSNENCDILINKEKLNLLTKNNAFPLSCFLYN